MYIYVMQLTIPLATCFDVSRKKLSKKEKDEIADIRAYLNVEGEPFAKSQMPIWDVPVVEDVDLAASSTALDAPDNAQSPGLLSASGTEGIEEKGSSEIGTLCHDFIFSLDFIAPQLEIHCQGMSQFPSEPRYCE